VKISRSFQIGVFPVDQRLYQTVMGENPSKFKGDDPPGEQVSWLDTVQFCNRLSERMGLEPVYDIESEKVGWRRDAAGMRLPTEAEWVYACRAGTCSRYAGGDLEMDLEQMGWYEKNSQNKTQPVGSKRPNAWGLYDMHGNVREWVEDDYHSNYEGAPEDGSAWIDKPRGSDRDFRVGFRLSRLVAIGS
jgi:formylglycine-generating enzyme required for sulfatase activity